MQHKILLVDDNQYLRESVSVFLNQKGFEVIVACGVIEARQYLSKQKPDLIISDVVMPKSDGYNLVSYVRSNYTLIQMPIILLTAKGMTVDRIKGYNLGCNVYLPKPFDPNELVSIINNLVVNRAKKVKLVDKRSFIASTSKTMEISFTPRELKVLYLVVRGLTNKDISEILHTSKRNVEKYVSRLLLKTRTRNRTDLAQYILRDDNYHCV
uniref:TctD-like protein n=1 Tax=Hildenbrandia rivularis TaxID=135206 RepID=A0A1C9CFQ1_9FLOR|nr:hypothetical protein Hrvl_132 [Hildenbrandia rivularis]AOM67192.1 hypothetical protein Hrvl_132 [Hildenbrandia rivularis]